MADVETLVVVLAEVVAGPVLERVPGPVLPSDSVAGGLVELLVPLQVELQVELLLVPLQVQLLVELLLELLVALRALCGPPLACASPSLPYHVHECRTNS